ncbi:MAG: hypothetical protein WB994_18170 [Candidatus Acidiferrum sp.]
MKIDWKLVVAVVALLIAILGFFGGGVWRTSDVVFDIRAVEIPLSDALRKYIEHALASAPSDSIAVNKNNESVATSPRLPSGRLPDKLLYVNIRNVGHVPSGTIKVRIVVPGQIADKAIEDAGSAFGPISELKELDSSAEISFACQNLTNSSQAQIKVALWYQQNRSGAPSVDIQDTAAGVAREVPSVDAARFYLLEAMSSETATTIFGVTLALFASVGSWLLMSAQHRRLKRRLASKVTNEVKTGN